MKKRILSVFLTAAILFGAASLSALGASNKIFTGEKSRYKIEGEVYKAYDELYGLTENLGNALDDKDSAKIDQSQSNWKLVCNTSYEDRPVYYKMIFNNDDNYIDIGPCVNGRDFLYKFGAILNKSSKRMIISPVYTYAFAQNVKTSTASLVFTAPKAGEVVLYDLYGDAITAMTEGPFWSFGTKDDEYHNKNGVMRADINFYRNTTLLATAQISETVHSADFPDLGKIEVAAGDTLKIEVLYKEDGSNGYGSRSERNAVSINPAVAYTKVYQESYSAYDYLNNVVEENKASIADGKVKLSPDSFKTSAPWNVTFSAPEGGNKWYSNTMYLKNSFSFNGSENVNKYAITGEAEGGKECMFVAFEDGKLVINGSYKGDVLNGYITSLNFTAPKSGNIELSSDTLTCMKDGPYWANGSVHTTTFSIKKNDSVLKTVTVNYASGNPSGWYVDGVEQAEATPVFPTVHAKVEKGDILTVEVTQGGKSNKSCAAITPVVAYTSVSDNGDADGENGEANKPKYGATYNAYEILGKLLQETEIDGNEIDQENSVWRVDISFPQWMATGYKGMVYKKFKSVANLKDVPAFARTALVQSMGTCTVGIPTDTKAIVIDPRDGWNERLSENIEFNIDFVAPATGKAVLYDPDEGIWGGIQGDPYWSYLEKDSAVSKIQVLLNDKVIWPASGEFTQIDNKNPAVDFPRIELNLKTGDVLRLRTQRVGGSGGFGMQLNPTVSYYDGVPQTGASYNGEIITLVALMSVSVLAIFTLVLIQNKKSRTDK